MEKLVYNGIARQIVPENYVFPPEERPDKPARPSTSIPIIDLRGGGGGGGGLELQRADREKIIQQILKSGTEYGFFQVVNHGVPEVAISDIMALVKEFFKMPIEEKARYYSEDFSKSSRIYTSSGCNNEKILYWRDCLKLDLYPVEEAKHQWPEKPVKLREALERYSVEVRMLGSRLLRMISEGLGLGEDYFGGELSGGNVVASVNYYAPCPDPSLTLGLPPHCDPNLITLLLQGEVSGLQVHHQGEWIAVDPLPNAFVVNFGHQLQVITNGMLKSVEHRAVTNSSISRISIATFIMPKMDAIISPAQSMVNKHSPQLYRSFQYQEFFKTYFDNVDDKEITLKTFMIN